MRQEWFVYILLCSDQTLYTGMTHDPDARLEEHGSGLDPTAYTFRRRPVRLVWIRSFPSRYEALSFEHQVKGWSRRKKEALIHMDWDAIHEIVRAERRSRGARSRRGTD
jgi:putative endonuclease